MTDPSRSGTGPARRRRVGIALAAAALLGFTGLATASQATAATRTTAPAVTTPAPGALGGWLVLETGTKNQVTLDANKDGVPEKTQALTSDPATCLMSSDQSLLKFTGTVAGNAANLASLQRGSIGVADRRSGASCSRVDAPNERLDLAVAVNHSVATSAYLDIAPTGNTRILATALLAGKPVGYFEMRTSSLANTTAPLPGGVTPTAVFTCPVASSSRDRDDDNHSSGDCRWPISNPSWLGGDDGIAFDTLSLQAVNGAFSVGSCASTTPNAPVPAGYPARASFFELATGILNCGDTTATLPAELTAPQVAITRLSNADGSPCTAVPYSLSHGPLTTTFLKPLAQQTQAQFAVSVVWSVPITPTTPASLPATTINYQSSATSPNIPLPWCQNPQFTGGVLTGILNPQAQPDQDGILPGVQYACVATSSSSIVPGSPSSLQTSEQIYLEGDAILGRGGS